MIVTRISRWLLLAAALFWLLTAGTARAQDTGAWQSARGPVAFVTHMAGDPAAPDFLFAFVSSSTLRNPDQTQTTQGQPSVSWAPYFSVDGGENWKPASNDLAGLEPTALAILRGRANSVIWVGTRSNGLWRSDNGGRTWRPALIPDLVDQKIIGIAQDARGRLHIVTTENTRYPATHLYTSDDGGYNWRHRPMQRFEDAPEARATDIVTDPFDSNQLYVVMPEGILTSSNAGFSWRRVKLPLADDETASEAVLATDPTQRGRLFLVQRVQLADGSHQIRSYLSLNSGASWQRQSISLSPYAGFNPDADTIPVRLLVDPLQRQRLLMPASTGLWLSNDGGVTWRLSGTEIAGASVRDVVFHPRDKGRWVVAGAGGVWRTRSAGGQWEASSQGLPAASHLAQVVALSGDSGVLLALNGGFLPEDDIVQPLWRSNDGGVTWMPARRGIEGVPLRSLIAYPHEPGVAFALTNKGIARTDNNGASWLHRPVNDYPLAMAADPNGPAIYLATAKGLQKSTNKGDAWTPVFDKSGVIAVTVDAAGGVFLVGYGEGGDLILWHSGDGSQTWQQMSTLPVQGAVTLHAHPRQAALLALTAPWEGLFVSTDGGRTWTRRNEGMPVATRWRGGSPEIPAAPDILALFMDPETGLWWASRDGGGIYRSLNNGALWEDATGDMGDTLIFSFARAGEDIVAGTSNQGLLWHRQEAALATPPDDVDVRIEIFWPHDFAPVTTAAQANLGLRLYRDHSLEPPPCAWSPNVEVLAARDADPLRRLDLADHRNVEGHPFPFWTLNDIDVTAANDPQHKLIFMARIAPGLARSNSSVWVHAADARTFLPEPPQPQGVAPAGVTEMDGRIFIVWPHDEKGQYVAPTDANLVNITAALFQRDTLQALSDADLPERVWLVGALDNQIGRRLAVGKPRQIKENGLNYTVYDFNDIDVSLARDPAHHWSFWLEIPGQDLETNVWVHGIDARTNAPLMVEPIVGCQP